MSWDHEVDVVVLGSGGAGLTAALTAAVAGASVQVYEKAPTVGGTTAVSGGIVWIPAHNRCPDGELTAADALKYLRAQSLGSMDDELVETFVRTGPAMLDFIEAHSGLHFEIATGFPDYRPELPGGRPSGGRSLSAVPFDLARLGEWATRITSFPADWSNVGFDAETRARLHAAIDERTGHLCVAGTALIAGLLKGLLDLGVTPRVNARAEELVAEDGRSPGCASPRPRAASAFARGAESSWARAVSSGIPFWCRRFCAAPCMARSRHPTTPGTGCGWRWRTARIWPTWAKRGGCPSSRSRATPSTAVAQPQCAAGATRPRSIIVNAAGRRFVNEACDYNSMAGAFHYLDPRGGYVNDRGWMVFDSVHLQRYGFLGVEPGQPVPDWFCESADLAELAAKTGIDADGLARTVENWNRYVAAGVDPDFGRGSSAYDGYWGDDSAATQAGKTLGPIDTARITRCR